MVKHARVSWVLLFLLVLGCGGDTQPEGGTTPDSSADPLAALPTNTATVTSDLLTADDLSVESCNRVVNTWLLVLRKRPYAVTLGLPSLDPGTYEADGGGQGLAITFSDATDLSDVRNYGIDRLKVVLEASDGEVRGTYEGEVLKDYVEAIPIRGRFRFDQSRVSE